MLFTRTVVVTILFLKFILCGFELTPLRCGMISNNEKYLKVEEFVVKKYHRRSKYYVNLIFEIMQPWSNNVTMQIIFYERRSNEYRKSFVEISHKLCTMLEKDVVFGRSIKAALPSDSKCPYVGPFRLMNLTSSVVNFPYKWPFEEARCEFIFFVTKTRENIAKAYLDLKFKTV